MSTGRHSTITAAQRGEFWRRYKAGESVLGIIGALRQRRTNIHRVLEASGGYCAGAEDALPESVEVR